MLFLTTLVSLVAFGSAVPLSHSQFHEQDALGQYRFGFNTLDQARSEVRGLDGVTKGFYTYNDGDNILRTVNYQADDLGFHAATGSSLPTSVISTAIVPETVEARRIEPLDVGFIEKGEDIVEIKEPRVFFEKSLPTESIILRSGFGGYHGISDIDSHVISAPIIPKTTVLRTGIVPTIDEPLIRTTDAQFVPTILEEPLVKGIETGFIPEVPVLRTVPDVYAEPILRRTPILKYGVKSEVEPIVATAKAFEPLTGPTFFGAHEPLVFA